MAAPGNWQPPLFILYKVPQNALSINGEGLLPLVNWPLLVFSRAEEI